MELCLILSNKIKKLHKNAYAAISVIENAKKQPFSSPEDTQNSHCGHFRYIQAAGCSDGGAPFRTTALTFGLESMIRQSF